MAPDLLPTVKVKQLTPRSAVRRRRRNLDSVAPYAFPRGNRNQDGHRGLSYI